MTARTPTDIEHVVIAVVADRLQVPGASLDPVADLRVMRAFSSFKAITILEELEDRFGVEIAPDDIRAERLSSVAALTGLFAAALAARDEVVS
jgi:acyl carrier protein